MIHTDQISHEVQVVNKDQLIAAIQNASGEFKPTYIVNLRKDGSKTFYRFNGGYTCYSEVHRMRMSGIIKHVKKIPKEVFE